MPLYVHHHSNRRGSFDLLRLGNIPTSLSLNLVKYKHERDRYGINKQDRASGKRGFEEAAKSVLKTGYEAISADYEYKPKEELQQQEITCPFLQ